MIDQLLQNQAQLDSGELDILPGNNVAFPVAMGQNDELAQGDLYIRLRADIPAGYKKVEPFKQMVPGNTKGSKHCWEHMPLECYIPEGWGEDYEGLLGPVVKTDPNALLHEEHGHVQQFCTDQYIEFGYQKNYDVEQERIRRQID